MPKKTIVTSDQVPQAIGPYSVAVRGGGFLFASGQLGIEPSTGVLSPGGIEEETRQSLRNLEAVLLAGGSGLDQSLRTTVYLRDLNDFAKMNAVYAEFFPDNPPARVTIQVAALPRGAAVEIDCIALASE